MLVPDIEEGVPLPAKATEALPDLLPHEELEVRARTIKLLSDLTGEPIIASTSTADTAHGLAKQMSENPELRPDFAQYDNDVIAFLVGLVKQTNVQLVDDLSELKLFVVNNLVKEYATAKDSKSRITALTKLGEVDGVDAFKKRSEVTHIIKPIEEVEKELLSVLEGIEYRVIGDENAATNA